MVLGLNSLPLRGSHNQRQGLQLLRPSYLPLSQRSCPAQWAGRSGEEIGYEQFGAQWKQKSDS